jgi:hypothetical protein
MRSFGLYSAVLGNVSVERCNKDDIESSCAIEDREIVQ